MINKRNLSKITEDIIWILTPKPTVLYTILGTDFPHCMVGTTLSKKLRILRQRDNRREEDKVCYMWQNEAISFKLPSISILEVSPMGQLSH